MRRLTISMFCRILCIGLGWGHLAQIEEPCGMAENSDPFHSIDVTKRGVVAYPFARPLVSFKPEDSRTTDEFLTYAVVEISNNTDHALDVLLMVRSIDFQETDKSSRLVTFSNHGWPQYPVICKNVSGRGSRSILIPIQWAISSPGLDEDQQLKLDSFHVMPMATRPSLNESIHDVMITPLLGYGSLALDDDEWEKMEAPAKIVEVSEQENMSMPHGIKVVAVESKFPYFTDKPTNLPWICKITFSDGQVFWRRLPGTEVDHGRMDTTLLVCPDMQLPLGDCTVTSYNTRKIAYEIMTSDDQTYDEIMRDAAKEGWIALPRIRPVYSKPKISAEAWEKKRKQVMELQRKRQ